MSPDPRQPGRIFRASRSRDGVAHEVDDELAFHFDMTVRELMAKGRTADEARREAERRFGDVNETRDRLTTIDRERVGQEQRAEWWSGAAQDFRYAVRGIRLKPVFAIVVIVTLGLGIGANAAMFGIVDRLLFRPPAYLIAPERTHALYFQRTSDNHVRIDAGAQYQRYLDLASTSTTAEAMAVFSLRRATLGTGENMREVNVAAVSASLWGLFDARPVLGRYFTPDEDRDPGGSRVVVLSYGLWQSQYGGARDVPGKTLRIGPEPYTIIGVTPRGFAATEMLAPAAYIPVSVSAVDAFGGMWAKYRTTYNVTWLSIFARRKPGVSVDAMAADLSQGYRRSWEKETAIDKRAAPLGIAKPSVRLFPIYAERGPEPSADTRVAKWLLGVAAIVLLIACANVGNLLLVRALRRQREIAVRMALGVRRARLVMQLLMESVLLSGLGAVLGLVLAQTGGRVLRATLMPQVEWGNALRDTRVLLFSVGVALAAGILAGMAPVLQSHRTDVSTALKAGAREGGGRRSRLRTGLLALQAALSVVLLVGAGLFVRSLQNINAVDPGYDVKPLVWIDPRFRGVSLDAPARRESQLSLLEAARRYPGVERATFTLSVPFQRTFGDDVYLPGADSASKGDFVMQAVSIDYFATVGTRIVQGRVFTADDRTGAPFAAVVSAAMARRLWPNETALDKCFRITADTMPCRTVVGVAEDVKLGSFAANESLVFYLPDAQLENNPYNIFVRVRGDAQAVADGLRRQLQRLMPGAGYVVARPMSEVVAPSMRSWKLGATMFAVFGGLALTLAAIGLYSVIAYGVAQRTHEMGVRVALGARGADVIRLVVKEGLGIVVVGVVSGSVAAMIGGRWLAPLLFHTSPRDPSVLAAVVLALMIVAIAASWLPALRASRVDPQEALRAE